MTLSGLTVAIGRVVDDSIVVMENIYRFIQQGDEPYDAAVKGTKEVAVASSTNALFHEMRRRAVAKAQDKGQPKEVADYLRDETNKGKRASTWGNLRSSSLSDSMAFK